MTKICNWIPANGHSCYRAPITRQIGVERTNHDREFCDRHDHTTSFPGPFPWLGGGAREKALGTRLTITTKIQFLDVFFGTYRFNLHLQHSEIISW